MSNLPVLPLFVRNRPNLQVIEDADLSSPLARALKNVPALARTMSPESLSALSATDRSCYHAVARHELWRDMWEPAMRPFFIGPLPQTPPWLANRDVWVCFGYRRASRRGNGHIEGVPPGRALYVSSDNTSRAEGQQTSGDVNPAEEAEIILCESRWLRRYKIKKTIRKVISVLLHPVFASYFFLGDAWRQMQRLLGWVRS